MYKKFERWTKEYYTVANNNTNTNNFKHKRLIT